MTYSMCVCAGVCVFSLSVVCNSASAWAVARQAPLSMGLSRQEHWEGCHALLQGPFLTQGSNRVSSIPCAGRRVRYHQRRFCDDLFPPLFPSRRWTPRAQDSCCPQGRTGDMLGTQRAWAGWKGDYAHWGFEEQRVRERRTSRAAPQSRDRNAGRRCLRVQFPGTNLYSRSRVWWPQVSKNTHGLLVITVNWKLRTRRNSLVVQWLRLCTFPAEGRGSIPGQGTEIPQSMWCGQIN